MDIGDVRLVVVYGAPSGMNQLHQVRSVTHSLCGNYNKFFIQLCGRAGRDGVDSRAHVFYSTKQKKMDKLVKEFCTSKENCRRVLLMKSLGSSESFGSSARCCDVCHPHAQAFLPQTQVSLSKSRKRKRRLRNYS